MRPRVILEPLSVPAAPTPEAPPAPAPCRRGNGHGGFRPALPGSVHPGPCPDCEARAAEAARAAAERAAAAARAEAAERRAAALERIAQRVGEVAAREAEFRRRWARAAAGALTRTLAGLLPPLAAETFATRTAAAVAAVIEAAGKSGPLRLELAAEDAAEIEAALAARVPDGAVALVVSPDCSAGEVRLGWPDGGIEFSAEALAAALRDELAGALAAVDPDQEESDP